MSNYGGLGLINGINSGVQAGLNIAQFKSREKQWDRRQDRLDRQEVNTSEYRDWQKERTDQNDEQQRELTGLKIDSAGIELDDARDASSERLIQRLANDWASISTNKDGSPRPMDEVTQSPLFNHLVNTDPEIKGMFSAGSLIDNQRPFAGLMSVADTTGNAADKDKYVAMLRRTDGKYGPLSEDRTDDPNDSVMSFGLEDIRDLLNSRYSQYVPGLKFTPKEYQTRQNKIADEEHTNKLALNLYGDKKDVDLQYSKKTAEQNIELGMGPDGKILEGSGKTFTKEKKLRDSYIKQSGQYIKVRDSYGRVIESAKEPSAAGDLALVFNYMKILDPGSVVRESEFATASNAAGVPDRIRNMYNRVLSGERLAVNQRDDFVDRAKKLYRGMENQHKRRVRNYKKLADNYKLNPDNIIIDLSLVNDADQADLPEDLSTLSDEELMKRLGEVGNE